MKLDILVISAHPDDAELGCSGTVLHQISLGYNVGFVDLTEGELGTRGTPALRLLEAGAAGKILGLSIRENAGLSDGFFTDGREECIKVIQLIRHYQPNIILTNAPDDRHPDHGMAARLVAKASFLSGLSKIKTEHNNATQEAWRPLNLFHYIQDKYLQADFVIDISAYWQTKVRSIMAYASQFHNTESNEPVTYISTPEFLAFVESRAREMGHSIGVSYGEGFIKRRQIAITNLFDLH